MSAKRAVKKEANDSNQTGSTEVEEKKQSRTLTAEQKESQTQLLLEANLLLKRNKFQDAMALYNQILVIDPTHTPALNYMGACYKSQGDNVKAMEYYQKVLALDQTDWRAHNSMGVIYKETGLFQEAIDEYKLAIQHAPQTEVAPRESMAIVLTDLGTRLKMAGSIESAVARYKEALRYNVNYAPAYFNLGVICSESGRFMDALRYYNNAVERNPKYVEALCNIGVIYKNSGQLDLAIQYYEKALAVNPNFVIANNNLAIAYTDMGTKVKNEGNVQQGIKFYKQALVFNAKYPAAWYNLGVAYAEQGRPDQAIVCYELAINFNPKCAKAYNNLGVIYKDKGNLDKSLFYYEEALKANPRFAQLEQHHNENTNPDELRDLLAMTLNNMGVIYTMLGKLDEAYMYCQKAIHANPRYAEAYNNLGVLYRDEGRITEAIQAYDRCLKLDHLSRNAGQNRLLAMNSLSDESMNDFSVTKKIAYEHKQWGLGFAKLYEPYTTWSNLKTFNRPLRVGYLSADFFTHSVSYFIEAPLAFADKSRTFVICYSNVVRNDKKTEHLQKFAHAWRTVFGMSSRDVAELVRKDKVDILIELTGHTAGNRLDVMAHKPAPVQITWIGYPNSTGLPTIDYRFSDEICDPYDTKQEYVEDLIRLPGPFLCYTPTTDAPEVGPLPALANGFVTFGSFNNLAKVNEKVLSIWCTILKKVPTSRILLKCKPFACASVRKKVLDRFEQEGIEAKRVDLFPLLPTTHEHLSSYAMVDISVDTFPYAGTTTTCEALFCGVPVVTLRRVKYANHAHNVGASLLSRIRGMDRFVATSEEQYIKIAVDFCNDLQSLSDVRRSLRPNMLASSLCDGKSFVHNLEDVYLDIWKHYCTGAPIPRRSAAASFPAQSAAAAAATPSSVPAAASSSSSVSSAAAPALEEKHSS